VKELSIVWGAGVVQVHQLQDEGPLGDDARAARQEIAADHRLEHGRLA
jgi:hypothetical protein